MCPRSMSSPCVIFNHHALHHGEVLSELRRSALSLAKAIFFHLRFAPLCTDHQPADPMQIAQLDDGDRAGRVLTGHRGQSPVSVHFGYLVASLRAFSISACQSRPSPTCEPAAGSAASASARRVPVERRVAEPPSADPLEGRGPLRPEPTVRPQGTLPHRASQMF